jgi:hypothetical protein
MLSNSDMHAYVCIACAEVCKACAESCEQIGGMEECVQACRRCAESCRSMGYGQELGNMPERSSVQGAGSLAM